MMTGKLASASVDPIDDLTRAASAEAVQTRVLEMDSLPAPVASYLRWALPEGSSIRSVRIQQVGTLRTDVRSDPVDRIWRGRRTGLFAR